MGYDQRSHLRCDCLLCLGVVRRPRHLNACWRCAHLPIVFTQIRPEAFLPHMLTEKVLHVQAVNVAGASPCGFLRLPTIVCNATKTDVLHNNHERDEGSKSGSALNRLPFRYQLVIHRNPGRMAKDGSSPGSAGAAGSPPSSPRRIG